VIARDAWEPLELLHAVGYFAPEADAALKATGLRGFWMGYFAARAAPFGPVGPDLVAATFHGFPLKAVARALPDAWAYATPAEAWDARRQGSVTALRRLLGLEATGPDVEVVAALGRRAAEAARHDGRALSAATAAMPWPDEPLAVAWHVATVLREHRGDGHVALLTAASLDGCEANVFAAARGATTLDMQRRARPWTDAAWETAQRSLEERGLIDDGALTEQGGALAEHIERRTDALAEQPYDALTAEEQQSLVTSARRLARAVVDAGELPFPNAIALPRPTWA
jgi:hypothetical protein